MAKRVKPTVGPKGSAPPPSKTRSSASGSSPVSSSSSAANPSDKPDKPALHYWHGGHTRHRVLIHLVFCPKYRRRVLEGSIASRLVELFSQCCEVNQWFMHELNVQPDHVHLLLQFSPSERISDVVQYLKGGSSHTIRLEFPDLEENLWGSSFWSDGYFCESVGYRDEATVRRYIRDQRKVIGSEENLALGLDFSGTGA